MSNYPQINLLIADDDLETCDILREFFQMQQGYLICGEAHNGTETLNAIRILQPDVVIMDIVMPGKDGINVLEELCEFPPEKRPLIIITSAGGQEIVTKKAASLGANYFLMKPYSLDSLLKRIRMVTGRDEKLNEYENAQHFEEQITRIVLDLGVPPQVLGFRYIKIALAVLLAQNNPCSIGKTVYAKISTDCKTTPDCAERAIRQTIKRIYAIQTKLFCDIMNYGNQSLNKCPSNNIFLTLTAAYLKLEKKL